MDWLFPIDSVCPPPDLYEDDDYGRNSNGEEMLVPRAVQTNNH